MSTIGNKAGAIRKERVKVFLIIALTVLNHAEIITCLHIGSVIRGDFIQCYKSGALAMAWKVALGTNIPLIQSGVIVLQQFVVSKIELVDVSISIC